MYSSSSWRDDGLHEVVPAIKSTIKRSWTREEVAELLTIRVVELKSLTVFGNIVTFCFSLSQTLWHTIAYNNRSGIECAFDLLG